MSDLRLLAPAAVVAVLALVGISSCDGGSSSPDAAPSASVTKLSDLDTTAMVVARDAFCSGIGPDTLQSALGTTHYDGLAYNNGEHARLVRGVRDVAHEYDCTWRAQDGSVARAWVFAPPVTVDRASQLRDAAVGRGCQGTKDAGFGKPSVATRCGTPRGHFQGYYGLFGDAWLSCTLAVPGKQEPADLTERASDWCAAVALAASGQTAG
ncbi:hypothetical protein [Nocardioides sp. LS1]|uniref:hypothetical protein n=1 Tax=Nocardioides sp. LS1 TaxID=1027620 RepID=UPI000F626E14|nr:hypothetical protein [Nocardioides sp. LS1]GCD90969.1 hypothetical protein NLS1_29750 [Nocardioides sp. LS1]